MVTVEPVVFVLRIGPDHNKLGDPYTTACTGIKQMDGSVELVALNGNFSREIFTKIEDKLIKAGFTIARWKRIKDGVVRTVEHRVKR